MKSPFPGMDPYLEPSWGDVGSSLVVYASDALNRSLPAGTVARISMREVMEEQYWIHRTTPEAESSFASHTPLSEGKFAESICLGFAKEFVKQRFVEIREIGSGRVFTVIEFVNPANKFAGESLAKYEEQKREWLSTGVNLVEIDLTRIGDRSLIMPIERLAQQHRTTYMATVHQASKPKRICCYFLPLKQRLGKIPIPLRPTDQEIALDLQSLVDQVYENGRYADELTYREPLSPSLDETDAQWTAAILPALIT